MSERALSYRWVMAAVTWLMLFPRRASWFCLTPVIVILMEDSKGRVVWQITYQE